jgi:hypothetical protein
MAQLHISRIKLFRILSLCLIAGGLMLAVRSHTRSLAVPYLLEGLLFLVIFGEYLTSPSRLLWAVPCLPAVICHLVRLVNFMQMGVCRTLYFWEVALLAVAYGLAIAVIVGRFCPRHLRIAVLVLFLVCIGFGVWDIIDGWWVMMNHTWTPLGERISMFVFYYIPDTMFWIFPFIMLWGKVR